MAASSTPCNPLQEEKGPAGFAAHLDVQAAPGAVSLPFCADGTSTHHVFAACVQGIAKETLYTFPPGPHRDREQRVSLMCKRRPRMGWWQPMVYGKLVAADFLLSPACQQLPTKIRG